MVQASLLQRPIEKGKMTEFTDEIIQVIKDVQVGSWDGELGAGTQLSKHMQLDDMDLNELVLELNIHYNIDIPDRVMEKVSTISDLADAIQKLRGL